MNLSRADARLLLRAAAYDDPLMFQELVDDNDNPALERFFLAHSRMRCTGNGCGESRHISCFLTLIQKLAGGDESRLIEVINYFVAAQGTESEKYIKTCETWATVSKTVLPDISADFMEILATLLGVNVNNKDVLTGKGRAPNGDKYTIIINGFEIVVRGDTQPPDDILTELLKDRIKNYDPKIYRVRRVNSRGELLQPLIPGFDKIDLDVEVPEGKLGSSFSEMIDRINAMKN
jgi:hypothetical protein